jgi:thiamine transporter
MTMTNTWLYSLLYNGTYMLPNTILAVVICAVLQKPLEKYLRAEK